MELASTFGLPEDAGRLDPESADFVACVGVCKLMVVVVWLCELVDGSGHVLVFLSVRGLGEEKIIAHDHPNLAAQRCSRIVAC